MTTPPKPKPNEVWIVFHDDGRRATMHGSREEAARKSAEFYSSTGRHFTFESYVPSALLSAAEARGRERGIEEAAEAVSSFRDTFVGHNARDTCEDARDRILALKTRTT